MIGNDSLVIIGGGPAGMSAAIAAYEAGVRNMVILERDDALGGILQQCIHNGFGVHRFGEELTGPEYAGKLEKKIKQYQIPVLYQTTVLSVSPEREVVATSPINGIFHIHAKAVILATGCRERPRGALNIPGSRPSGIYTAGTAQNLINRMGYMPGKRVVILGSGDIGLIMARRLTLEGAKVLCVCEIMPYSSGLARNIEQCLNDFDIPLYLNHTVTDIEGTGRLTGVTVSKVDAEKKPIPGTEMHFDCDTLLLSCGLIPENEVAKTAGIVQDPVTGGAVVDGSRETSVKGIFACGNALHVHDLADYVSDEADIAGKSAAAFMQNSLKDRTTIQLQTGKNVRYTVPQKIETDKDTTVYFRVTESIRGAVVSAKDGNGRTVCKKVCPRVAPGEMQTLTLKQEDVKTVNGTLVLEVSKL